MSVLNAHNHTLPCHTLLVHILINMLCSLYEQEKELEVVRHDNDALKAALTSQQSNTMEVHMLITKMFSCLYIHVCLLVDLTCVSLVDLTCVSLVDLTWRCEMTS